MRFFFELIMKLLKIDKLSQAELVNTAVFAAIWGLAEISLGTFLHASKIPFRGALMSLLAIAVLVCAKIVLRYKGSLILLGIVTATFRLFLGVGFNITPFAAIIIESVIAEIIINKFGFRRTVAVLTGVVIMVYSISHGLIMQALFLGIDIYKMYYVLILQVTNKAGLSEELVLILILFIPVIQIGLGAVSGSFGLSVGSQIKNMIEE